jgi:hypothetical protein
VHPEQPADPPPDLPPEKTDMIFFVFFDRQTGQDVSAFSWGDRKKTSKTWEHLQQLNSYIGMDISPCAKCYLLPWFRLINAAHN